jgi:hypothetical protein
MKVPVLTVLLASAAVVFATGEPASEADSQTIKEPEAKCEEPSPLPAGSLIAPLTPQIPRDPVTVPEPVLASVLAACAVTLLRRGRTY